MQVLRRWVGQHEMTGIQAYSVAAAHQAQCFKTHVVMACSLDTITDEGPHVTSPQ
jgi:hypothetical protein